MLLSLFLTKQQTTTTTKKHEVQLSTKTTTTNEQEQEHIENPNNNEKNIFTNEQDEQKEQEKQRVISIYKDIKHNLQYNTITQLSDTVNSAFDIKVTLKDTIIPSELVSIEIGITTTPPQDDVFITVNMTLIKFSAFYGCVIDSQLTQISSQFTPHGFVDYYPSTENGNGGLTNDLHLDILRIFLPHVNEQVILRCEFAAPVKTPEQYLILNAQRDNIVFTNAEQRPALPIESKVYKLLHTQRDVILDEQLAQENQYRYSLINQTLFDINILPQDVQDILYKVATPNTFRQHQLVEYFRLTPLAQHIAYHKTTFVQPTIAEAVTFRFIRGEVDEAYFSATSSSAAQYYFTAAERAKFFAALSKYTAQHVVRGMFLRTGNDEIHIVREAVRIIEDDQNINTNNNNKKKTKFLIVLEVVLGHAPNADNAIDKQTFKLSERLSGLHTNDALSWIQLMEAETGLDFYFNVNSFLTLQQAEDYGVIYQDPKNNQNMTLLSLVYPPLEDLPDESSTTKSVITKAFSLTRIVSIYPSYDLCLLGYYASECDIQLPLDFPCHTSNQCASGWCEIDFASQFSAINNNNNNIGSFGDERLIQPNKVQHGLTTVLGYCREQQQLADGAENLALMDHYQTYSVQQNRIAAAAAAADNDDDNNNDNADDNGNNNNNNDNYVDYDKNGQTKTPNTKFGELSTTTTKMLTTNQKAEQQLIQQLVINNHIAPRNGGVGGVSHAPTYVNYIVAKVLLQEKEQYIFEQQQQHIQNNNNYYQSINNLLETSPFAYRKTPEQKKKQNKNKKIIMTSSATTSTTTIAMCIISTFVIIATMLNVVVMF